MLENKTWREVFEMLRDISMTLGRAPKMEEVKGGLILVNSLKHGGWFYVLGYAGIFPAQVIQRNCVSPCIWTILRTINFDGWLNHLHGKKARLPLSEIAGITLR